MNSLWTSQFAVPDWDMFWSGHSEGAFHAAARAISGGPVYVSDKPGQQDFAVLGKLVTADGRVLACCRPALPAADCVFRDPLHEPVLLKITNRSGPAGVLGIFNCRRDGAALPDTFAPGDIHDLPGTRFAVYRHNARTLELLSRTARGAIALPPLGWEILTVAPLLDGCVAPLGLLEKYNGAAALERAERVAPNLYRITLRAGGRVGIYCRRRPRRLTVNGRAARARYDRPTGLLTLTSAVGAPVGILLELPGRTGTKAAP